MSRPGLVMVALIFWISWLAAAAWSAKTERRVGGLLPAVYATTAAKGTIPGVLGALLVTLGPWMKAGLEERWLRAELDAGAHDDYRRKVPMLVPFGPR